MCVTAALRTARPPTGPRATLARQWMVWHGFQRTGWPSRIEEKRYDGAVSEASRTVVPAVTACGWTRVVLGIHSASGSDRCPMACAAVGAAVTVLVVSVEATARAAAA